MSGRLPLLSTALLGVCLTFATLPGGAAVDEQVVAKVKAAYLLNFVRYSEWPP